MKHQALFSSKDKIEKLKGLLLRFLFGTLRVNIIEYNIRRKIPFETGKDRSLQWS